MNYREALDYIYGYTNYEAVPKPHAYDNYDLRRVFEILEKLGNPHLKAKSLHVAGTNGKGSTAAMLASIIRHSGYKTGLYTSPHLVTSRERFMINGKMISESELAGIATALKPEIEAVNASAKYGRLTVFEILTVLCFVYFAQNKCDFQVMEVGMGGRYDATNVIQPEICLLASISFDHTAILGNTLTLIATEKCGIIKPGCVVISHPQAEQAEKVIENTCREKGVNLIKIGKDIFAGSLESDFDHQTVQIKGRLQKYTASIPLLGDYQADNAAAAVAAAEVLKGKGYHITKESILKGLAEVDIPARKQIIGYHPFIVVSCGDNPGAARRMREAIQKNFKPARSILVTGISSDKDVAGIIKELAPAFDTVIATRAKSPRAAKPETLAAEFAGYGLETRTADSVAEAVMKARSMARDEDLICITGSLYVVGEAIAHIKGLSGDD